MACPTTADLVVQETLAFCWVWWPLALESFFFPFLSGSVARLMQGCPDLANHFNLTLTGDDFGCAFEVSKVFRGICKEKDI